MLIGGFGCFSCRVSGCLCGCDVFLGLLWNDCVVVGLGIAVFVCSLVVVCCRCVLWLRI